MGQPENDIEQERIRELSKYYCTFDQHDALSPRSDSEQLESDSQETTVRLSADTTLTALTQLGVYRFGCNRSFVSIIDGERQHIIAEATASVSLRKVDQHVPDDGIFLGVTTLDLEWGVCPHAIRLFTGQDPSSIQDTENITANQTRNIIRDFTKEDFYKDRSYVTGWPYFRFYAEVPLYSPSGHVLGSYCVVDDKPREGFGDKDVAALREIADSITNHLENARIVQYHRRSESLVKGLTDLVKSHSRFDPTGFSTESQIEASTKKVNPEELDLAVNGSNADETVILLPTEKSVAVDSSLYQTSSESLNGQEASIFSRETCSKSTSTLPSSLSATPSYRTEPVCPNTEGPPEPLLPENVPITERIAALFSRASKLLKESLDLDGVVFLDAHRNDPQFESPGYPENWEAMPKFTGTGIPIPSRSDASSIFDGNPPKDTEEYCGSLGQALSGRSTKSNVESNQQVRVTEELLHLLIAQFPEGQIFNLDSKRNPYPSAESANCDSETSSTTLETIQKFSYRLARHLPEAKCVLFYPLWDWNKSRWLAGTLVWVNGSYRPLGVEDLHYFRAFGDSIISEVSRAHWTASENSKFDFVTSISHELRSPLHGILASAELLQDIPLQPAHREMVNMISTSGLTLLDTIDHLLDYCKINNLTTTQSLNLTKDQDAATCLFSDFNLDSLVEEVAVILHTGQTATEHISSLTKKIRTAASSSPPIHRKTGNENESSVIVNVEQFRSWKIRSVPGAWRRIVMNLLGNAMKWTRTGLIEVSLSQAAAPIDENSYLVHLRVADTGQGMSSDFLRNSAFSAFSQEDALSEGVGLGLSVVHKLVTYLGGHIKMRSEAGVGTQIDVYVPSERPKDHVHTDLDEAISLSGTRNSEDCLKACLIGFNGYPDLTETPTGIPSSDAKRKLSIQSTLASVFKAQLGWQIVFAESLEKGEGDIAVIEEARFEAILNGESSTTTACGHQFKYFIVLGSTNPWIDCSLPHNAILVSQPYGPHKLYKAAQRIMDLHKSQPEGDAPQGITVPVLTINQEPLSSESTKPQDPFEAPTITLHEPPVDLVCPSSAPGGSPVRSSDQMQNMHVLIVDDNDINVQILATFMRKIGCTYDTASNGLIALQKVESSSRRYDHILMDLSMPIMDGLVSTSKIRQHEKDQGLVPSRIMAVTGVASDTMQQAAVTAGVDDYLVKPLSLRKLKQLIEPTKPST